MFELTYPSSPAPVYPRPNYMHPGPVALEGEEMLPLVEENGLVIGQAPRGYCHGGSKALHPVVHLHLINRFGQLYVQKRSLSKDLYPGRWDTAVGGHVSYGELILEALLREAREELGLTAMNPIYLMTYVHESDTERELVNVFAAVGNFDIDPHNEEVSEGRWWDYQEIKDNFEKSIFTPNFEEEFGKISDTLLALL